MPNEDVSVVEDAVMKGGQTEQEKYNDYMAGEVRQLKLQMAELRTDTSEIVDIVRMFRGAGEFLSRWGNRLRTAIIFLTPIGTAAYWVWKFVVDYKKAKGEV